MKKFIIIRIRNIFIIPLTILHMLKELLEIKKIKTHLKKVSHDLNLIEDHIGLLEKTIYN